MAPRQPSPAAVGRAVSSCSSLLRGPPARNTINTPKRSLSSVADRLVRAKPLFKTTPLPTRTQQIRPSSSTSWLLSALPNLSASPPPQTLHARKVLPYPPRQIYNLIADVGAYRAFLPHCSSSLVRAWASSPPSPSGEAETTTRAPSLADLTVGWGPFTETYTSRVYCVPPGHGEHGATDTGIVEAVSGKAQTTIAPEVLRALGYEEGRSRNLPSVESGIFQSLVTRWTVRPISSGTQGGEISSEVTLTVKFQFANAMLGHAVGQLAKEKVDEMVEAFENRAGQLYGKKV